MKTIGEEPWGAARFAYAYLASLLAFFGACLVAAIAYPLIGATGLCRADEAGWCMPASTVLVGFAGLVGCLFLVARVFLLGWEWALWVPVLVLVLGEIVVETNVVGLAWTGLVIPALAAWLTYSRPDKKPSVRARLVRLIVAGVLVLQFVVWIVGVATIG
ncbi:MAG: hypothetical protein LBN10_07325 [Propionibacteriaceae bacterium]|nr:hypothetical protein [Propionibacteriaceae bacterium]